MANVFTLNALDNFKQSRDTYFGRKNRFKMKYCNPDNTKSRRITCEPYKRKKGCGLVKGTVFGDDEDKKAEFDLIYGEVEDTPRCDFDYTPFSGLFNKMGESDYKIKLPRNEYGGLLDNPNYNKMAVIDNRYLVPIGVAVYLWGGDKEVDYFTEEDTGIEDKIVLRSGEDILILEADKLDEECDWECKLKEKGLHEKRARHLQPVQLTSAINDEITVEVKEPKYYFGYTIETEWDTPILRKLTNYHSSHPLSPTKKVWRIGNEYYHEITNWGEKDYPLELAEGESDINECFKDKYGRIFCKYDFEELDMRKGHPQNESIENFPLEIIFLPDDELERISQNIEPTISRKGISINNRKGKNYDDETLRNLLIEITTREELDDYDKEVEERLRSEIIDLEEELLNRRLNYWGLEESDIGRLGDEFKPERRAECDVANQSIVNPDCSLTKEGMKLAIDVAENIDDIMDDIGYGNIYSMNYIGAFVDSKYDIEGEKPKILINIGDIPSRIKEDTINNIKYRTSRLVDGAEVVFDLQPWEYKDKKVKIPMKEVIGEEGFEYERRKTRYELYNE